MKRLDAFESLNIAAIRLENNQTQQVIDFDLVFYAVISMPYI